MSSELAMRTPAHESCGPSKEPANSSRFLVRPRLYMALSLVLSLLYISTTFLDSTSGQLPTLIQSFKGKEYAIKNVDGCSIPDFDPFAKSTRHVFHKVSKPNCSDRPLASSVRKKDSGYEIVINKNIVRKYYKAETKYTCCYNEVWRDPKARDQNIKKSKCHPINEETMLSNTTEFILVSCQNSAKGLRKGKVWYKNGHALIPDKESVQRRLAETRSAQINPPISVLLISIDSISRLNLMRSMPKTARHLHDNGWIELRGYNKIGDNTYPNLMAVLTGKSPTNSYVSCKPTTLHGLDNCWFIWKNYSNAGYVTAYGEDYPSINTFNYRKKGFYKQPTDYYMRPLFLAINSFTPASHKYGQYCSGPVSAGRRIYDYALDFTNKFRDDPFFALFWMNSFSHNEVNMPNSMDGETMNFFDDLQKNGILDTSVVFFFSDHGIRFGKSRQLFTGFYEERLPFFFAWLPDWFRERYPDLVEAFVENSNRLTTPYDFHVTLLHLLSLADNPEAIVENGTKGCSTSQSLFKVVSSKRSCSDACIDPHWCTCGDLVEQDQNSTLLKDMALAVVDHLNNVELFNHTMCSHLSLYQILTAKTLDGVHSGSNQNVIVFETAPGRARFEATISKDKDNNFIVHDQISRLNTYEGQSDCVSQDILRKYCFCVK
ncbi:uncharacterized protein LOC113373714 isoform X2 [Ctenocephalides felis]|uniref:uncharacterized protein LOC113373714 isoform X2 n=1 Tax=Ctenocephalides felis TaxID=7515 RepID=UPI000E6E27E0|nr:uncharacterized protein LOC113373714 isoform X2 [Ctenocephalides felis]